MKRKALALVLCLAVILSVTLPGTLAVSTASDSSESKVEIATDISKSTPNDTTGQATGDNKETVNPPADGNTSDNTTNGTTTEGTTTEGTTTEGTTTEGTQQPADGDPVCTCGTEDGNHKEDCPCYVEPKDNPEGKPPVQDTEGLNRGPAYRFTNVAPLMQFDYGIATLELNDADYGIAPVAENNNGVVLNKTATANDDGSFDITLEAYVTGATSIEQKDVVADIVLVLDTSGSMSWVMSTDDLYPVYGNMTRDTVNGNYQYTEHVLRDTDGNLMSNSSNYFSRYQKYYIVEDEELTQVWWSNGWRTSKTWNSTPYYPKTSEDDSDTSHTQFYTADNGDYRLNALKTSVNNFIESVFTSSPNSNIAIVSFADEAKTISEFTNSSGKNTLLNGVENLEFKGSTDSGKGMQSAADLLTSLQNNAAHTGHSEHKKIVIMFTDGEPTRSNAFENDVANQAIAASKTIKDQGATVYTIGIFAGAQGDLDSFETTPANTYMHLVSSNYPEATSMANHGDLNPDLNGKSYYLSAANSSDLNEIFKKISYEVGGADNSELNSSTVVKDIIAPSFTVPANTSDIKFYTAECNGKSGDELTFKAREEANGMVATIDQDNATLDVSGFNFSENWCGYHSNSYGGKKLIIEFTVSPKAGFLGGNDVPTNGASSGLYSNGTPVGLFEVPTVNVPIQDITIEASDKNVYLTQVPGESDLKSGVTIKCGTVDITDPSQLADWQKAYVNIESSLTTSEDFNATADGSYSVTATVSPKTTDPTSTQGTAATEKTKTETKNIYVFTPELTYKDSQVWYGDTAPTTYDSNLTNTVWKHDDTVADTTKMGEAPTLGMTYAPGAGVVDGKIEVKTDIPVAVTVKIGTIDVTGKTSFVHTPCSTGETAPTDGKFWLHVKTCTLTITKAAATGTTIGTDEYFVFNVLKDGQPYTQVTIKGTGSAIIKELPVGTYSITEDTSVAWRYGNPTYSANAVLSSGSPTGTLTCTNTKITDNWLNHFSRVINTYGKTEGTKD